jgi:hypothetical protein
MEMDIVLRALLTQFDLQPTSEPDEGWKNRGIAYAPANGGRAIVSRHEVTSPAAEAATERSAIATASRR